MPATNRPNPSNNNSDEKGSGAEDKQTPTTDTEHVTDRPDTRPGPITSADHLTKDGRPEAYKEPDNTSQRIDTDGNYARVNTEVPSHATNATTNISYTDSDGELQQLNLEEYTQREANGTL